MVATLYTAVPLPFRGMRNEIHNPQHVLARNLRSVFDKRGLSARSVAKAIKVSNKTVSNMLNGDGAPQLDKLISVAAYLNIPLWQLLSPAIDPSHFGNALLHEIVEGVVRLSETGQAAVRRTIKGEALLAKTENIA